MWIQRFKVEQSKYRVNECGEKWPIDSSCFNHGNVKRYNCVNVCDWFGLHYWNALEGGGGFYIFIWHPHYGAHEHSTWDFPHGEYFLKYMCWVWLISIKKLVVNLGYNSLYT